MLFRREPSFGADAVCDAYYNSQVFFSAEAPVEYELPAMSEAAKVHLAGLDLIVRSDPRLAGMNQSSLRFEATALRLDLFAFAWTRRFRERERFAISQAAITKSYLASKGLGALWTAMLDYAQAVAQSSYLITSTPRGTVANIAFLTKMRSDIATAAVKKGADSECADAYVNHAMASVAWEKGLTARSLAAVFLMRCGFPSTAATVEQTLDTVSDAIRMLYDWDAGNLRHIRIAKP